MEQPAAQFVDVRRYVRIVLANSWIVLLAVAIASVATYLWSSQQPNIFEASSLVRVYNPKDEGVQTGNNQRVDPVREVGIQVLYAQSPDVVTQFESSLGKDASKLSGKSVTAVPDADAIQIAVRSKDKHFAQAAARTYTNTYVDQRRSAIAASYADQSSGLRRQAAALDTQIAGIDAQLAAESTRVVSVGGHPVVVPESSQSTALQQQRASLSDQRAKLVANADQLDVESNSRQSEIDVIKPPGLPTTPASPLPNRDAAVGGLVGLFLGLGIAVFRYRLGDHITESDELVALLGPNVLVTSIPSYRSSSGRATGELAHIHGPARVAEAYRILRAELMFATSEQTPYSLLISSARGSEGKTTVACNLAASLATAGMRVALVDADLRHGRVHEVFELSNQDGLSQLRKKNFDLARAMQRRKIDNAPLDILTAGPVTANPAELLLNPSSLALIAELKKHYQYVIIDGPPVLPVADALHLARSADGVLLVAQAHQTQFSSFRHELDRFTQAGATIVGAVLVGADTARSDDKYYNYMPKDASAKSPRKRANNDRLDLPTLPPPAPPRQPIVEPETITLAPDAIANGGEYANPDVVNLGAPNQPADADASRDH